MIPVREPGHDHALEVRENRLDGLRVYRRRRRQRTANVTGLGRREDWIFLGMGEVCGDPIEDRATLFLKDLRGEIAVAHLHRKILSAMAKHSIIQTANTPNSGAMTPMPAPRSMFARSASFVAVSGSA